ncbi:MAG: hypothetical protein IKY67_10050 [Paludibacteraceae bacterium]|nr:hypothetical protein [Paludibacteraceae bacterium]
MLEKVVHQADLSSLGENYNIIDMTIYDSIAVLFTHDPRGIFPVINLKQLNEIGVYVSRGRAFNELSTNSHFNEILVESNCLKAVFYDLNKNKIFKWNISKSIENQATIFDTIIEYNSSKRLIPYADNFQLKDNIHLVTTNGLGFRGESYKYVAPEYTVNNIVSDKIERKYKIFKDSIVIVPLNNDVSKYFYASNAMRPDKSKLAMVLSRFPQVNILDITSGLVKGSRIKGLILNPNNQTIFYSSVCCDNNYIYALYNNINLNEQSLISSSSHNSRIHIFDWEGNLVRDVELDGFFQILRCWNGLFYAVERASGKIYTYKLDS